jgi:two-component system, cell cycle sensor histidine kinase and response regulator CckA
MEWMTSPASGCKRLLGVDGTKKGPEMKDATHPETTQPTILLVDDHPSIRLMISAGLKANGFMVLAASSGEEALDICRAHTGAIDVLLSDLGLTPNELKRDDEHSADEPITNGLTLVKRAMGLRPSLKVVLFSAHSDQNLEALGVFEQPWKILRKPVDLHLLIHTLQESVHGPERTPSDGTGAEGR